MYSCIPEPEDPPSPEKQQVSVSWVQDLKFKKEQEKLGIPAGNFLVFYS